MAFRKTPKPVFTAKVTVLVPNDDCGYDENTFVAKFKRATVDEQQELKKLSDTDLVRKQLVGWTMEDEETKEDVPFTPVNMEAALQISPTPFAIALAFWETVNGARSKNL